MCTGSRLATAPTPASSWRSRVLALPITAVQILWVNLITGITLGIALAFEPTEAGTMARPPRRRDTPILSGALVWHIVLVAALMTPALTGLIAERRFPLLEKKRGGHCCIPANPRGGTRGGSIVKSDPIRIPRKVIKGGSHLCAPNYCQRYRPESRQGRDPGLGTSNVGLRLAYDTAE